jgi:hypothetical protein
VIYLLLALYPREWRRRYALEVLAHFGERRLGWRERLDLIGGAIDAHLHPQWPVRRRHWAAPVTGVMVLTWAQLALSTLAFLVLGPRDVRWSPLLAIGGVVLWTVVFCAPARRRWPLPIAIVTGLALDILLLSPVSPITRLGWKVQLLGILAWALVLTAIMAAPSRRTHRRHQRWNPDDPAAGTRSPRKPYDPDPEPLEAIGQLRR